MGYFVAHADKNKMMGNKVAHPANEASEKLPKANPANGEDRPVFMKTDHSAGFQAVTDFPAYCIRSKIIFAVIPQIQSPEWQYKTLS